MTFTIFGEAGISVTLHLHGEGVEEVGEDGDEFTSSWEEDWEIQIEEDSSDDEVGVIVGAEPAGTGTGATISETGGERPGEECVICMREEKADGCRDLSAEVSGDDAVLVGKEDFSVKKGRLDVIEEFKELEEEQTKAFERASDSVTEEVQRDMTRMLLGR